MTSGSLCRYPVWHVMVSDQVIELGVTFLDVESDEDEDADDGKSCSYDCLQLFDGDTVHSEPLSARLCGRVAPSTTFVTSSNAACVHFRSDYFTTRKGFELGYHVVVPQQYRQTQRSMGTNCRALSRPTMLFLQSSRLKMFMHLSEVVGL